MSDGSNAERTSPAEQARIILESVTDAVFLLDREFRFAYLNGTARRLLQRDDLVGTHIWTEFPAARGTRFQDAYERAMHQGVRVDFVEYYPAPLDRWYEVRAYPSPEGVSVYFHDITERRLAEAAYARSRAQMELVVRGADVGVWYCPLPFDELLWDDKVKEHFHLPPDARVTIETFYERLHPDDRERTRAAIDKSVAARTHYDIEYRTVSPDGQKTRWIRAIGRAFYAEDGTPLRFDGITLDVSDRKAVERERERVIAAERAARAEAEQQSRIKDEFLATLSHELRTPLTAILGWTQILSGRAHDDATARALAVIARNAAAQARLVEDLLDTSRMLAGGIRLDVRRVALGPLVAAGLEAARPAADARGVRLSARPAPGADDAEVIGDPARLQQVLWNLLSNAIKFSPPGGAVEVALSCADAAARIVVRDDGEGIAPDFLPFVFDRFRQADASTSRQHGGLGLGLSIVRHLVELHGGTVQAASGGRGQGSAFTVQLPRAPAAPPHDASATPPGVVAADECVATPREPAVDLHGVRALVVDDDHAARVEAARALEAHGAAVTAAESAAQALEVLQADRYDVLVVDLDLPRGDDDQAPWSRVAGALPAVALTPSARATDRARAAAAGFALHAAKPLDAADLATTVAAALGRLPAR